MRRLAIDFGTSNTVAALAVDGQAPRTVTFGPSSLLPSAVYGGRDGITVGREAQRQARLDPARFEPNPKRRIDDGDVLLGEQVFPVVELIAAVLRTVAGEVRRQFSGQSVDEVRLTHPAQWGSTRQNTLLTAARLAGLGNSIQLIPEPVAAAAQFTQLPGRGLADGRTVAIYDLGGGTFDVAVVGRSGGDFVVLAEGGLTDLGGLDFDQAILDLVGRSASAGDAARWQAIARPTDGGTRRAARALAEDIRAAKETLSDYSQTEVALPDPFDDVHLTRSEFEGLVRPNLMRSVEVLDQTLRNSGVAPATLSGVFLVGGSSRIPLVARLVQERFNIIPVALDQPETAVALGALAVPRVIGDMRTRLDAPGPASGPMPARSLPSVPPPPPPQQPPRQGPQQQYTGRQGPGQQSQPGYQQPGNQAPGYQQPVWAGRTATRSRSRIILVAAAVVVVVVLGLLIIAKPFASSHADVAVTTPVVVPPASQSLAHRPTTSPAASSTSPTLLPPTTLPPTTAPPTSSSPQSSAASVPGTLTDDETAFLGGGFEVGQCVLPDNVNGAGAPVRISREILCSLTSDVTGGDLYALVLTLPSVANADTFLDFLVRSRGSVTGSVPDEDHAFSQNSASGRVISAEKLPVDGVNRPAVAWTEDGQSFVGLIVGDGSMTITDLATYWNQNVGQ